ncbi:uncharacterized protein YbjT (DUF2867 family) [Sinomonas atrocyanea]|uniref:SDR family oxidoreductase n=1 Tax=Sinomonas atrocyanea TaxID=37927 RepID=UPI002787E4C3|nr:SDR family oxidoreductase [Sinomonas atrocyanea]MDP9886101.1 uncharacterized protein YbjT (DUF2867 family) [Sinomonas atrocyanea]
MTDRPQTVLVVGATGSVGRHAVAEALRQGLTVRVLVRNSSRARTLPAGAARFVGDLTRPETLKAAVEGADAVVFTHGSSTSEPDVREIDYGGVRNILSALGGRPARIALMSVIGATRRGSGYAEWKRRSERLVRASGNQYTIVRPGWFDYNSPDQRTIVMLQGDTRQSGSPADGVIARDEIARVLIDSLSTDAADHRTFELVSEHGPEQDDLAPVFAALAADPAGSLDAAEDAENLPLEGEPAEVRRDLDEVTAAHLKQ